VGRRGRIRHLDSAGTDGSTDLSAERSAIRATGRGAERAIRPAGGGDPPAGGGDPPAGGGDPPAGRYLGAAVGPTLVLGSVGPPPATVTRGVGNARRISARGSRVGTATGFGSGSARVGTASWFTPGAVTRGVGPTAGQFAAGAPGVGTADEPAAHLA
jgi:hypothetical protein